jgi:protein-L-isoaspartate O-methyltransferase
MRVATLSRFSRRCSVTALGLALALPALAAQVPSLKKKTEKDQSDKVPKFSNRLAPFVVSPTRTVEQMLELANLKPGETLYDLGCGDGRILIAAAGKFKVKAVGVEISPRLVARASDNIQQAGLTDQARVMQGDLLTTDVSGADVVTLYLTTSFNEKLRPRLEKQLRAGARVISNDYPVPGWKPTRVVTSEDHHAHRVYVYEMPPAKSSTPGDAAPANN